MSPSLHTYIVGTVVFATKRRMFVSGIARYQLMAAVSAPGSPIAWASRSAEVGKGREGYRTVYCLVPWPHPRGLCSWLGQQVHLRTRGVHPPPCVRIGS